MTIDLPSTSEVPSTSTQYTPVDLHSLSFEKEKVSTPVSDISNPVEAPEDLHSASNIPRGCEENVFGDDPAKWIVNDDFHEHAVLYGCKENVGANFEKSKRVYKKCQTRSVTLLLFERKLQNGEKSARTRLIFQK